MAELDVAVQQNDGQSGREQRREIVNRSTYGSPTSDTPNPNKRMDTGSSRSTKCLPLRSIDTRGRRAGGGVAGCVPEPESLSAA